MIMIPVATFTLGGVLMENKYALIALLKSIEVFIL